MLGENETNLESKLKNFKIKNTVQILPISWDKISVRFGSEWSEEDNMPLNILQKIFLEENGDLTTIGSLVA